jgi:hypothetical protein
MDVFGRILRTWMRLSPAEAVGFWFPVSGLYLLTGDEFLGVN